MQSTCLANRRSSRFLAIRSSHVASPASSFKGSQVKSNVKDQSLTTPWRVTANLNRQYWARWIHSLISRKQFNMGPKAFWFTREGQLHVILSGVALPGASVAHDAHWLQWACAGDVQSTHSQQVATFGGPTRPHRGRVSVQGLLHHPCGQVEIGRPQCGP